MLGTCYNQSTYSIHGTVMNDLLEKSTWKPTMNIVAWDGLADTVMCSDAEATEAYAVGDLEAYYPHIRQGLRAALCITRGTGEKLGGLLAQWSDLLRQPLDRPPILGVASIITGYQPSWLARWSVLEIRDHSVKITMRKVTKEDVGIDCALFASNQITLGCTNTLFEANFPGALQIHADCALLGMMQSDIIPILRTMILDRLRNMETLLPYDVSPA